MLFTLLIAGHILTAYSNLLTGIIPAGNSFREYAICAGQILFQGLLVTALAPAKRWEYLGNMMTISFAGALLLLPLIAISKMTHLSPITAAGYFLFVAGLMLLEHIRRTKLLALARTLTITWVLYRLVILLLLIRN